MEGVGSTRHRTEASKMVGPESPPSMEEAQKDEPWGTTRGEQDQSQGTRPGQDRPGMSVRATCLFGLLLSPHRPLALADPALPALRLAEVLTLGILFWALLAWSGGPLSCGFP